MKKRNLLIFPLVVLPGIIKIIDLVVHFETSFAYVGYLLYSAIILAALAISFFQKSYLVGIIIVFTKFILPNLGVLVSSTVNPDTLTAVLIIKEIIAWILFSLAFFIIYSSLKNKDYRYEAPRLTTIVWPFVVFGFYAIFKSPQEGFLVAIAELLALLLGAHLIENFLWVSAFIFIPFEYLDFLSKKQFVLSQHLYFWLGIVILGAAVYSLIKTIDHLRHKQALPPCC